MAEFEQNVIRNIYDIVDGSNAALFQALLHPVRRRSNFEVMHDPACITSAEIGFQYLDIEVKFFRFRDNIQIGKCERNSICSRQLASDAHYAQTVGPVRRHIYF